MGLDRETLEDMGNGAEANCGTMVDLGYGTEADSGTTEDLGHGAEADCGTVEQETTRSYPKEQKGMAELAEQDGRVVSVNQESMVEQ